MNYIYQIELTNHCTLNCSYCPQSNSPRPKGYMALETYQNVLRQVKRTGQKVLILHHFGETALHPSVVQFVSLAAQQGFFPGFSTNGVAMTQEKFVRLTEAGLRWLCISLHNEQGLAVYHRLLPFALKTRCLFFARAFEGQQPALGNTVIAETVSCHDFAGTAPETIPFSRKGQGHTSCDFLRKNYFVVLYDGTIVACCRDERGVTARGTIDTITSVKQQGSYRLCARCQGALFYQGFRRQEQFLERYPVSGTLSVGRKLQRRVLLQRMAGRITGKPISPAFVYQPLVWTRLCMDAQKDALLSGMKKVVRNRKSRRVQQEKASGVCIENGARTMSEAVRIRPYRLGDEEQLVLLFAMVFNRPRSLQQWQWEFQDNPAGEAHITVAEVDGKIVGAYSALPMDVQVGEKRVRSYQVVDSMVHPSFRGEGIFVRLGTVNLEAVRVATRTVKMAIRYGFPTRRALAIGGAKLGYRFSGNVPRLVKHLIPGREAGQSVLYRCASQVYWFACAMRQLFRSWRRRRTQEKAYTVVAAKEFPPETDMLWQSVAAEYGALVVRDAAFLNWRYVKRPQNTYTILLIKEGQKLFGYAVLGWRGSEGVLVDVLTVRSTEVAQRLLDGVTTHFRDKKAEKISCYASNRWLQRQCKKNGFIQRNVSSLHFASSDVFNRCTDRRIGQTNEWFLTYGDAEI